jgi:hypothetical protein
LSPFVVLNSQGLLHSVQRNVCQQGTDHASYNVAKKVLEWEFKEEIPRSRLRAAYGEGFKGAPLRGDPLSEGAFSRDVTARDAHACSQEAQAAGGRHHV